MTCSLAEFTIFLLKENSEKGWKILFSIEHVQYSKQLMLLSNECSVGDEEKLKRKELWDALNIYVVASAPFYSCLVVQTGRYFP